MSPSPSPSLFSIYLSIHPSISRSPFLSFQVPEIDIDAFPDFEIEVLFTVFLVCVCVCVCVYKRDTERCSSSPQRMGGPGMGGGDQ